MNSDTIEGNWEQVKGKVKTMWGKLTDDDLTEVKGKSQQLIGKLQERYGYTREQAEKEFKRFSDKEGHCCGDGSSKDSSCAS